MNNWVAKLQRLRELDEAYKKARNEYDVYTEQLAKEFNYANSKQTGIYSLTQSIKLQIANEVLKERE